MRDVLGIMVANILGSFIMGFLTENKAHLLWFEAPTMPVSFLPENNFIQYYQELLTGKEENCLPQDTQTKREREREKEPGTQRLLLFFSFSDFFPLLLPSRIACGVLWLFDDVCKLGIPDGFYSDEWTTRSCAPRASA